MHEGHITKTIIKVIEKEMRSMGNVRLKEARIRLGELSGIKPEPFKLYFEEFTKGTPLGGALLTIETAEGAEVELISIEAATAG
ncbi:MAG: hydrogenase maturation nickel metallochaperone HypA [Deltaproteobacteria bacterium]|nr:hydrogenase maturation nickel metallochaperone HypA [Deltaproteobacteria bacterium]